MKSSQLILAVCALLSGIAWLFDGEGQDGRIGAWRNEVVDRASQDEPVPPAQKASPVVKKAAASNWAAYDDEGERDASWPQPDIDEAMPADTGPASPTTSTSFDIRPIKPVFAAAGASVAKEQRALRER
jgi:hypothetical protein